MGWLREVLWIFPHLAPNNSGGARGNLRVCHSCFAMCVSARAFSCLLTLCLFMLSVEDVVLLSSAVVCSSHLPHGPSVPRVLLGIFFCWLCLCSPDLVPLLLSSSAGFSLDLAPLLLSSSPGFSLLSCPQADDHRRLAFAFRLACISGAPVLLQKNLPARCGCTPSGPVPSFHEAQELRTALLPGRAGDWLCGSRGLCPRTREPVRLPQQQTRSATRWPTQATADAGDCLSDWSLVLQAAVCLSRGRSAPRWPRSTGRSALSPAA